MPKVYQEKNGEREKEILKQLKKEFPEAKTALQFSNPLEFLISTILSAQCTDVRVNMVTPALFAKYPTVKYFAHAQQHELEMDIKSTGFYHNKAKNIIGAAQTIMEKFGMYGSANDGRTFAIARRGAQDGKLRSRRSVRHSKRHRCRYACSASLKATRINGRRYARKS